MTFLLGVMVLAFTWAAITGAFTFANIVLGAAIAVAALWFIRDHISGPKPFARLLRIISLTLLFFYELLLSAIRVAALVISPNMKSQLRPAIIAFPLTAKSDSEITLLANLITLTPGTLSIDVSEDRSVIYVHAIAVSDREELIAGIASGFEAKIIEVFE